MSVNPVVAGRVDEPVSAWSGVWIAEDIELIGLGVRSGSWVDGSLGVVGAGLDGLALVSDPVGVLLQYGVSWLIEHVRPLSRALEWVAGDPAAIAGHARTWRNAATALHAESDALARAVRWEVAGWSGAAADAYRRWADQRDRTLWALGSAAETMAGIVEGAGALVGTVRVLVRDAVATVVSRLVVYAAEVVGTAGLAAPLVVEQVSALCASWAVRIAGWLRALIASLRRLMHESERLSQLIEATKARLKGQGSAQRGGEPKDPQPDPNTSKGGSTEEQRVQQLGMDPATKRFRPTKVKTAVRIEQERGVTLTRAPEGHPADWFDSSRRSYDAVGPFPSAFFERQWPRFSEQIELHLKKADYVPVDVSTFSRAQVARVEEFINQKGLGSRVFIVGR
jgi:uncharacterized protein YukE